MVAIQLKMLEILWQEKKITKIKKYFKAGNKYKLWSIKVKDIKTGNIDYIFRDISKPKNETFTISFLNYTEAENMIAYLLN